MRIFFVRVGKGVLLVKDESSIFEFVNVQIVK